ncbi:MAG: hypothetical protein HY660_08565 [Armatimonadetes bacterium]|nr:hypothetical protein [Armatimonadota bacterium]
MSHLRHPLRRLHPSDHPGLVSTTPISSAVSTAPDLTASAQIEGSSDGATEYQPLGLAGFELGCCPPEATIEKPIVPACESGGAGSADPGAGERRATGIAGRRTRRIV